MSWVFVSTNVLAQAWGAFRTIDVCADQFSFSRANYMLQNMQASTELATTSTSTTTTTTPTNTKWVFANGVTTYGFDLVFDTIQVVAIVNNAMNTYFGVMNLIRGNENYIYEIGHNAALLVSRIFVLVDKTTPLYYLSPAKPWVRFKSH